MLADALGEPVDPEMTDDHPQLERPHPAAEGRSVVHEVGGVVLRPVGGGEVFGHEREGIAQDVGSPRPQDAAVDRCEEPLVRVDDDRVGALRAGDRPVTALRTPHEGGACP